MCKWGKNPALAQCLVSFHVTSTSGFNSREGVRCSVSQVYAWRIFSFYCWRLLPQEVSTPLSVPYIPTVLLHPYFLGAVQLQSPLFPSFHFLTLTLIWSLSCLSLDIYTGRYFREWVQEQFRWNLIVFKPIFPPTHSHEHSCVHTQRVFLLFGVNEYRVRDWDWDFPLLKCPWFRYDYSKRKSSASFGVLILENSFTFLRGWPFIAGNF